MISKYGKRKEDPMFLEQFFVITTRFVDYSKEALPS